jgi:nucleotide-binding universal stress UspA family protein
MVSTAGLRQFLRVESMLAALDFSPVADSVLAQAIKLAERFGARLWLIHVAAPEPAFVGYEPGPQTVRDQRAGELREEHRTLQRRAEELRERGLDATALLIQGPPVEKILEEASRLRVEMIVMGSHGRSALARFVLGSVSEGVVRRAACPVLIVPALRDGAA